MALTKITQSDIDTNNVKSVDDTITGESEDVKNVFDKLPEVIASKFNTLIDDLTSILDGSSGADNIGATAIEDLDGATVQLILKSLRNKLKSTLDGSSGADFIAATQINGLTGETVQSLIKSLKATTDNYNVNHKAIDSTDHDNRYYTKSEVDPYLRGGDTLIIEEVFTIVNGNLGDGTFTYTDKDSITHTGTLNESGNQTFELFQGYYDLGLNRVEATINDTLRRSTASGGLTEVDTTHITLTDPQGSGAEITFKYFQQLGIVGTGLLVMSNTPGPYFRLWD